MEYNVSKDIQLICDYLSFSYSKFASEIGVSEETISRIVSNQYKPSLDLLDKIYGFIYDKGINLNETKVAYYKNHGDIVLFHGSKDEIVGKLSLDYSRRNVDLGQGFYTGDNYEQSVDFVCQTSSGSVYVFDASYKDLKILKLDVSLEWMLYIAINRGKIEAYKNTKKYKDIIDEFNSYDVIIAPIADNRMFTTIDDFVKSAISSEQAIHALKDLSLGKQIVFKTEKSLKHLKMLERLFVSKNEKDQATKKKIKKINDADEFVSNAYQKYIRQGQYISEIFK